MTVKELIEHWENTASEKRSAEVYTIRLPLSDAARLHALSVLYPGRTQEQLLTDLLGAALDELQAAFPYVQGQQVAATDEQGDPIYADAGYTARFDSLTKEFLKRLEKAQPQS